MAAPTLLLVHCAHMTHLCESWACLQLLHCQAVGPLGAEGVVRVHKEGRAGNQSRGQPLQEGEGEGAYVCGG